MAADHKTSSDAHEAASEYNVFYSTDLAQATAEKYQRAYCHKIPGFHSGMLVDTGIPLNMNCAGVSTAEYNKFTRAMEILAAIDSSDYVDPETEMYRQELEAIVANGMPHADPGVGPAYHSRAERRGTGVPLTEEFFPTPPPSKVEVILDSARREIQ